MSNDASVTLSAFAVTTAPTLRPLRWSEPSMTGALDPSDVFVSPVGTVTFLLTDVEGSTTAWQAAPESMGAAIARHYEILDERRFRTRWRAAAGARRGRLHRRCVRASHRRPESCGTGPAGVGDDADSRRTGRPLASAHGDPHRRSPDPKRSELRRSGHHPHRPTAGHRPRRSGAGIPGRSRPRGRSPRRPHRTDRPRHPPFEGPRAARNTSGRSQPKVWAERFRRSNRSMSFPNNLPLELSTFVGRQSEIAAVCAVSTRTGW